MEINQDVLNELLSIEAMSQILLEKSKRLRIKLAGNPTRTRGKKPVFTEVEKAAIIAAMHKRRLKICATR